MKRIREGRDNDLGTDWLAWLDAAGNRRIRIVSSWILMALDENSLSGNGTSFKQDFPSELARSVVAVGNSENSLRTRCLWPQKWGTNQPTSVSASRTHDLWQESAKKRNRNRNASKRKKNGTFCTHILNTQEVNWNSSDKEVLWAQLQPETLKWVSGQRRWSFACVRRRR